MKRIICLLLALLMCLALVSCHKTDVNVENDEPVSDEPIKDETLTEQENEVEEEPVIDPATIWNGTLVHPDEEGFFDPDYDYCANPRYKVCVFNEWVSFREYYEAAFSRWCDAMNLEFGGIIDAHSNLGDAHEQLRELAREYDGIILTRDYDFRYSDILDEEGCPWIYWMYESRNEEGNYKAPAVINFSYDGIGSQLAENAVSYYKENLADIPVSQVGVMYITFSGSPQQCAIEAEFVAAMSNIAPELAENVLIHDNDAGPVANDSMTFDAWYDKFFKDNKQYTYWLCCTPSYADFVDVGAAFSRHGLADNAYIFAGVASPEVVFGGDGIPLVVSCCAVPCELQVEPIIGALYGFMTGELSPETIWGGNENGCGSVVVNDYVVVTRENYDDYRLKLDEYFP